jgi:O-antigen ligase
MNVTTGIQAQRKLGSLQLRLVPDGGSSVLLTSAAVAVGALMGWLVATRPLVQTLPVFGLVVLALSVGIAAGAGFTAFEYVVALIALVCALVDLPRVATIGPVTLLGALTVAYAAAGLLLSMSHQAPADVRSTLRLLRWFTAYALIYFILYSTTIDGFQNVAVFITFVTLAGATAAASFDIPNAAEIFYRWFDRAMFLGIGIYLVSVLLDGFGAFLIVGNRSFALFALLGVARGLSLIRYGSRSRGALMTIAATGAIFLSLSRTALVISLILIPLAWLDRRSASRRIGVLIVFALTLGVFAFASTVVAPLRERFAEPDRVSVGGVTISVTGRDALWSATWRSWLDSPWLGHGAGTSEYLPLIYLPKDSDYGQPHNDYLRILHDYGVVGGALWLIGAVALFRTTKRAWREAVSLGSRSAGVHLWAILGMTALGLAMITDNVVIYVFFMAPLGIIVGLSLGLGSMDRSSTRPPMALQQPVAGLVDRRSPRL